MGELKLFAILSHKIWLRRNKVVFGGPVQSPSCLLKCAKDLLGDYRRSLVEAAVPVNRSSLVFSRWSKPAAGTIKINWDASLDVKKKIMGVGIIARNSMGLVKAAMCTVLPYIQNPSMAEAIGARRVVEFAREMGFSSIELEGDSREVVLALGSSEQFCGFYGNIVMETWLLLGLFPCWRITHVGCDGSKAAHCLAKLDVSQYSQHVWVDVCPSVVLDIVCAEQL
ncbi:uncharacterized protein LOC133871708 [Alnus glutinosa]|uniref:uncharacterized protein LOC133871708 n=1 Tax=Alnus glutinosa TaxID=3517 RepID=UPI002D7667BC|nr:uncharacterized protein LOC133871708 [Alnus glutinosa]